MVDPNDLLVQLKIISAIYSFVALGSTLYRLYKRRGRFWADDHWALFAFVALIMQVVAVFLHVLLPNRFSKTTRVAAYYLMATAFYAVIWGSRLSILFSIVRIDPSTQRRKRLSWVVVAFVAVLKFLLAQLFWVCEPDPSWMDPPNPQCRLTLRRLDLAVSLVHAAFILRNGGIKIVISALVEVPIDCISLIVANIPVVVTTMVDIVGDADQARATRTTPLSTGFWYHEAETAEACRRRSSKSTWNQNEQPDSEQAIVGKVSSTHPIFDRRSYLYPTSPL
ncbi:hypothetical protein DFH08DRAFT_977322 [Mycena albidolilacea]|uniref:Uncharacterized protein n=1 Tax=Mycena albidolilacea TaxID=1033008 RepID=A0AAD6Z0V2_9AGAR|nr:hypothetical protein DFH08DRAFT_977322 [Mycena albidolilacea]